VDMELVDGFLGDAIIYAWENSAIRGSIEAIRGSEDDCTYFEHFEALAKYLIDKRQERIKKERRYAAKS